MAKAKNKAVVSKSKAKHRSFRLTPKTGLLVLAVIAALSVISTLGYNKIQYGSFTAKAARIYIGSGQYSAFICKYPTSLRYGLSGIFTNNSSQGKWMGVNGGSSVYVPAKSSKGWSGLTNYVYKQDSFKLYVQGVGNIGYSVVPPIC